MLKKTTSYSILNRLIRMSKNNYGIIEYDETFNQCFSDIPLKHLYNTLNLLSRQLYIDVDYLDLEEYTFQSLQILPEGYKCQETKITNRINTMLSVTAIIISFITLIVSIVLR